MIIRNLQPYRTCMCYSVKTIIVWGQGGHKEAVVKGMTALVIYRGPKHAAVLSPSSSLPLYTLLALYGCTTELGRAMQSICGVVRKHVLGYETPEEEEGRHCSAA